MSFRRTVCLARRCAPAVLKKDAEASMCLCWFGLERQYDRPTYEAEDWRLIMRPKFGEYDGIPY